MPRRIQSLAPFLKPNLGGGLQMPRVGIPLSISEAEGVKGPYALHFLFSLRADINSGEAPIISTTDFYQRTQ